MIGVFETRLRNLNEMTEGSLLNLPPTRLSLKQGVCNLVNLSLLLMNVCIMVFVVCQKRNMKRAILNQNQNILQGLRNKLAESLKMRKCLFRLTHIKAL